MPRPRADRDRLRGLGDLDRAFEWLERAYAERDMAMVHLDTDPYFDPLRADPRFADLRSRMGLDRARDGAS